MCRSQGTGHYGQNIDAVGWSADVPNWDPTAVVANSITNDWYYSEYENFQSYYNEASPPTGGPEFLHFTQIVWKGSDNVGCASHYCGKNTVLPGSFGWYTVCNYFPAGESPHPTQICLTANKLPGNVGGEFNTEISKPVEHTSVKVPFPS